MSLKLAVQTAFTALDRVTGPVNAMGKSVDRYSRNAQRAGAGIGASSERYRGIVTMAMAAITTGAAAKALSDFASRGDDIADVSKRIGLSAEALQELQYAAQAADMSADDLTGMLQKMNGSLGQLKTGTGRCTRASRRPTLSSRFSSRTRRTVTRPSPRS